MAHTAETEKSGVARRGTLLSRRSPPATEFKQENRRSAFKVDLLLNLVDLLLQRSPTISVRCS
jgi:hypothetical protein